MFSLRRKKPSPFDVSASHDLAIRRHWPWPVRAAIAVLVLLVTAATAWWAGHVSATPETPPPAPYTSLYIPPTALGKQEALNEELTDLRKQAASLESELSMREGAQTALDAHAKALEEDNAQLKEELAYLQKLVADATSEAGVRIQDLRVEKLSNNQWRYRTLLVQGGNPKGDFEGEVRLQALANPPKEGGGPPTLTLESIPGKDSSDPATPLPVKFKYYQRIEGMFRLADGAKPDQFTVQVFKKGDTTPAIARSINLP